MVFSPLFSSAALYSCVLMFVCFSVKRFYRLHSPHTPQPPSHFDPETSFSFHPAPLSSAKIIHLLFQSNSGSLRHTICGFSRAPFWVYCGCLGDMWDCGWGDVIGSLMPPNSNNKHHSVIVYHAGRVRSFVSAHATFQLRFMCDVDDALLDQIAASVQRWRPFTKTEQA